MKLMRHLTAAAVAFMPLAAAAQTISEERIKELVLETIRENPGIVFEAVDILERQKQEAQAAAATAILSQRRDLLENDPNAPVLGNPDGDVTIVEFFDYNCPFCRKAKPFIEALLEQDPNVRLVYREWPILGEGSVYAARAALASREQGLYEEFHWAMMGMQGRAEEASVLQIAADIGLDIDQLQADMNASEISQHIEMSNTLSQSLGFTGTPSFVIGDALVPGVIETDQMADLVAQARSAAE